MERLKDELVEACLDGKHSVSSRMKAGAGPGSLWSSWMVRGGRGKGRVSAWAFSLAWICAYLAV